MHKIKEYYICDRCKKEINELLDKFLEQDLELNPLEEEILDVMDTNFKHKLK